MADLIQEVVTDWREADWRAIALMTAREATLALRGRSWHRLQAWFLGLTLLLAFLPILYRTAPGHWQRPDGRQWLLAWSLGAVVLQLALLSGWTHRRVSRELDSGVLDELVLTGTGPADILLGKAFCTALLAGLLTVTSLPGALFINAVGGGDGSTLLKLLLLLALAGYAGLAVGLESGFLRTASSFTVIWQVCYFVAMISGIGAFIPGGGWITWPRRFLLDHNPLTAVLAVAGVRPERFWPAVLFVAALVLLANLMNVRLLRREWSNTEGRGREKRTPFLAGDFPARPRVAGYGMRPEAPLRLPEKGNPLPAWEAVAGARFRVSTLLLVLLGLLLGAPLVIQQSSAAKMGITGFLILGGALAAFAGAAPFNREREQQRWLDLVLTPMHTWELVWGKLRPSAVAWRMVWIVGGLVWLNELGRPGSDPGWHLWSLCALLVTPPAWFLVGAATALVSPSPADARWRLGCLAVGVPALGVMARASGMEFPLAPWLHPGLGAAAALGARVGWGQWLGLLILLLAAGWALGVLRSLRRWVVPP